MYIVATNWFGHSMSQLVPFDEIKFERNVCLKEILNTADDSDIGCFLEIDFSYPFKIRQKTKQFPFGPENRRIDPDDLYEKDET